MMKIKTKIAVGAVIVAAGAAFTFLQFRQERRGNEEFTGPTKKVVVGAEAGMLPAAVWIAEAKGFFKREGLEVTIKPFDSGRLSFLAMLDGEGIDISTVAPTPIMFKSFDRDDFAIFATFVYSYDDVKVIAREDKGVKTVVDLKGRKVGATAGTTGQFFLNAFLTDNGIPSSEVEEVDIAPSELPEALERHEVDAIVIWEPHARKAEQLLQGRAVRLPTSEVYKETFNFMVTKDYAVAHPDVLESFLRAADAATKFIASHTEESQSIVARRLDLDLAATTELWDDFVFEISLDQSLLRVLEDEASWALRNGLARGTKMPNYLEYLYPGPLEAVKPEAVTLFH